MFKHALLATCFFAAGVLVRDVAQDYRDARVASAECQAHQENAARYAKAITHLLGGGKVSLPGVEMSCRTKHLPVQS